MERAMATLLCELPRLRRARASAHMPASTAPSAGGLRQIAWLDCPGGGQVSVDGTTAYVAHMKAPHGPSIVGVSDPARPRVLATLEVPPHTHSHKVRAANGLMLVN